MFSKISNVRRRACGARLGDADNLAFRRSQLRRKRMHKMRDIRLAVVEKPDRASCGRSAKGGWDDGPIRRKRVADRIEDVTCIESHRSDFGSGEEADYRSFVRASLNDSQQSWMLSSCSIVQALQHQAAGNMNTGDSLCSPWGRQK